MISLHLHWIFFKHILIIHICFPSFTIHTIYTNAISLALPVAISPYRSVLLFRKKNFFSLRQNDMFRDADSNYFKGIYIVYGYTGLHFGIDSLAAINEQKYHKNLLVPTPVSFLWKIRFQV